MKRKCLYGIALVCCLFFAGCGERPVPGDGKGTKVYEATDLKVGDYFYSDGTWSDGGLRGIGDDGGMVMDDKKPLPLEGKKVIGIVFSTDTNRIGMEEKRLLAQKGVKAKGLVMSVRLANEAKSCSWGIWRQEVPIGSVLTLRDCYEDIDGLSHTMEMLSFSGGMSGFSAFHSLQTFDTVVPVGTTGWYLPSIGQWWDILQNLGGVSDLASHEVQTSHGLSTMGSFFYGEIGVCQRMNAWMVGIPASERNLFKLPDDVYWTSSVLNARRAKYVGLIDDYGYVYLDVVNKPCRLWVRGVLAF